MPMMFMMVGLPGSGKSTFLNETMLPELRSRYSVEPCLLSPDGFIEALDGAYNDNYYANIANAWRQTLRQFGKALSQREPLIVFDACHKDVISRSGALNTAIGAGYDVIAVYLCVSLETALERNARRPPERKIDERVVRTMFATFEPPLLEEGFLHILRPAE